MDAFLRSYTDNRFAWEEPGFCASGEPFWHRVDNAKSFFIAPLHEISSESACTANQKRFQRPKQLGEETLIERRDQNCYRHARLDCMVVIDLEELAYCKIHDWITSLFITVAEEVIGCFHSSQCMDRETETEMIDRQHTNRTSDDFAHKSLITVSKENIFSSCLGYSPIVKFRPKKAANSSLRMGGTDLDHYLALVTASINDRDVLNPEQPTTAKAVSMWGRRLERIPKVRVPGQSGAIYCFDARKQRRKQCQTLQDSVQGLAQDSVRDYRAKPIRNIMSKSNSSSMVLHNHPASTVVNRNFQGQVLSEEAIPIQVNSKLPAARSARPVNFVRLPLEPRTNKLVWKSAYSNTC